MGPGWDSWRCLEAGPCSLQDAAADGTTSTCGAVTQEATLAREPFTEAEMCTSPCPIEGLEAARRQTYISGKGSGSWGADPEGAGGLLDWRIQQNDMGPQV